MILAHIYIINKLKCTILFFNLLMIIPTSRKLYFSKFKFFKINIMHVRTTNILRFLNFAPFLITPQIFKIHSEI